MSLLLKLATAHGQVVTHETLAKEVWNGRIVGDEAIFRAISELRKALGDDPREPRFIETIRKRGYRLAIMAEPDQGDAPRSKLLAVSVSVAAIIVALIFVVSRPVVGPAKPVSDAISRPLTTLPGRELDPAISSDGERVVFAWNKDSDYELYTKHIASESLLKLTYSEGFEGHPAWSPDETKIAYVAERADGPRLEIIDSLTGGPPISSIKLDGWSYGLDWSPNGHQIALSQPVTGGRTRVVFLDLESGKMLPPKWADNGQREYKAAFSPNGEEVAFMRGDDPELAQLWIANIETGAVRQITRTLMSYRGLDWASDGQSVVAAASTGGNFRLLRISLDDDGQLEIINGVESQPFNPTVSKSGRIAYESAIYDTNVWRLSLSTGVDEPVLSSTRQDRHPDLSPDQSKIVFVSDRTGDPQLWLAEASGANARPLTQFDGHYVASPRFSLDGAKVSFQIESDGQTKAAVYWIDEGRLEILDLDGEQVFPIRWKNDSSLLVYVENGDLSESIVVGLDGQVLQSLGQGIVIDNTDGNQITIDPDANIVRRVDRSGLRDTAIDSINPNAWAFSPGRVYFSQFRDDQSFAFGVSEGTLTDFAVLSDHDNAQFSVSNDGNIIYYGRIDSSKNDLYWRDL